MSKHREFTRQEFYDLVWAMPIVKLAKEFGLSDVGLRKTCVRATNPDPPLGYWAKLSFGKPVKKIPLPPPGPGIRDRVLASVFAAPDVPEEVAGAALNARERIPGAGGLLESNVGVGRWRLKPPAPQSNTRAP